MEKGKVQNALPFQLSASPSFVCLFCFRKKGQRKDVTLKQSYV
jgi:hypothetical protein